MQHENYQLPRSSCCFPPVLCFILVIFLLLQAVHSLMAWMNMRGTGIKMAFGLTALFSVILVHHNNAIDMFLFYVELKVRFEVLTIC